MKIPERIFIEASDFLYARKKIREAQKNNAEVIFYSNEDELNRKILEKEKINVLLVNLKSRKDKMKQSDSGFNQIIAKLAKKNNVSIGIDIDEIIQAESPKEKAEILARAKQNIKLCTKNKLKIKFVSKKQKDIYDLRALGSILGMPTWLTKDLELILK